MPHLTNYSDDPHMCGRLMFHPLQVGREYSLGFSQKVSGLHLHSKSSTAICMLWAFCDNVTVPKPRVVPRYFPKSFSLPFYSIIL